MYIKIIARAMNDLFRAIFLNPDRFALRNHRKHW